ncbi:MAG: hypothetical protein AAF616_08150 [Bacteroidota bacterium]
MKQGEKKFLILLLVLFVIYVATSFLAPKPIDWRVTFANNDKNPFGGFILAERAEDLFNEPLIISNQTLSQLPSIQNILILCDLAELSGPDYRSMMARLDSGAHIMIAANRFSSAVRDSLGFNSRFSFHALNQGLFEEATSEILIGDSTFFEYPYSLVSNYFELKSDTSWLVQATLEQNPILISRSIGKGRLTLCTTPYVFTNFGLLIDNNYQAAQVMLSELPMAPTHFTLFYQLGKAEATTPFRYFLKEPALRWSLYLGLFVLVVFLVITSSRYQRSIPVVASPANATVSYVKTLGALFYREGNHKNAAQRLINYFFRSVREKYYVNIDYTEKFYQQLSAKSGVEINHVIETFELIQQVKALPVVNEQTLLDLSKKTEQFQ